MSQTLEEKWLSLLTLRRHHVFKLVNYRHNQAQIDPLPAFKPFFQLGLLQVLNEEGCEINYHTGTGSLNVRLTAGWGSSTPGSPNKMESFCREQNVSVRSSSTCYLSLLGWKAKAESFRSQPPVGLARFSKKSCRLRLCVCCLRQTRPFISIRVIIILSI